MPPTRLLPASLLLISLACATPARADDEQAKAVEVGLEPRFE